MEGCKREGKRKEILFVMKRNLQAIKKILAENFQGKEESKPQIDLFKNLWLETEASLCSVNYMARFNRLKIEMDKGNSQKANGEHLPKNSWLPLFGFGQSKFLCSPKILCLFVCLLFFNF